MLERFHKIFGIQPGLAAEQDAFVQRINQTAIHHIEQMQHPKSYEDVFKIVCYKLGINANDRIADANSANYFETSTIIPRLRSLTNDEFVQTLKVLVVLHEYFEKIPGAQKELSRWIEAALSNATSDIGVKWHNGMFYPSGAQELDEKLIEEPLQWLSRFPNERADYLKALDGYANKRLDDVVIN